MRSCFCVFQKRFLCFGFLHPTVNSIQYTFQQAFFALWCFCLTFKCCGVLNNFRHYFYEKAFKNPLKIIFKKLWLCILKLLPMKYLLRFLLDLIIISLFSIFTYYVLLVFHALHFYACFVNISVYILSKILIRLSNFFDTNSFVLVNVNVDDENGMHRDLVTHNNFINYKVLPAFNFDFIDS